MSLIAAGVPVLGIVIGRLSKLRSFARSLIVIVSAVSVILPESPMDTPRMLLFLVEIVTPAATMMLSPLTLTSPP